MNGLTLRINKIGNKRSKNDGFHIIVLPKSLDIRGKCKPFYDKIMKSTSGDEQLAVIKELLQHSESNCNEECVKLLVELFLQADAKHPIKCFISRYITKNTQLQGPFAERIIFSVTEYVSKQYSDYKLYVNIVMKIAGCTENFPTGANALQKVELILITFLKDSIECCIETLRNNDDLTPTEQNDVFSLTHLALRLLLQSAQKINSSAYIELKYVFDAIRCVMKNLMYNSVVPMDTKSLCAIVCVTLHMLENGSDAWLDYLEDTVPLLSGELGGDDEVQLSLYSAIVTIIPVNELEAKVVDSSPAIVVLSNKIFKKYLSIGERSYSESIFILGVSRTMFQISKLLLDVSQLEIGLQLVDKLIMFVWMHSEHYMDSVRHLSAQTMACIVKYCNKLRLQGNDIALIQLFNALNSLDQSRKSYFLCVKSLVEEMGAQAVIERLPNIMETVVQAVKLQAVQASATTALETIIQKHAQENQHIIDCLYIAPIVDRIHCDDVVSTELSVLEGVLVKAVKIDSNVIDIILPHIKKPFRNLKPLLTLLSVVRKANATELLRNDQTHSLWKGIISYEVLKQAAVDSQDEVRVLSLSLIVNSPKSTELFSQGDLDLVLYYLKYNINVQSPNFRQLTISILKKFIKRLEDSYKVIKRQSTLLQGAKDHYYLSFVEELRSYCFDSLLQGTNYSRRFVALQILVWVENILLEGYERIWKESYVDKLLLHLEDSYENNKAMALEVLEHCPVTLLKCKTYSTALDLESILRQVSSTKPTDCVSAGYKFILLIKLLPENILTGQACTAPEPVIYTLTTILLEKLNQELNICKNSVCDASRRAPMYGLVSCVRRCFQLVNTEAIASSPLWTSLISTLIQTSLSVCASVECVVNNTSPEGHLPMDGGNVDDWGNSQGLTLEDGRLVTAQMVLLCAWRSVKEVSLLLGDLTSCLSIPESLSYETLGVLEAHFTKLLMNTKHRGAFEQVYVGYTRFLSRIWKCRNPALAMSPQTQLQNILEAIRNKEEGLCATRRSAGLPFMIQALLTTSLFSNKNVGHTRDIMSSLLELSRHPDLASRSHAANVLRALFRNTELTQAVSGFVGEALVVALEGFSDGNWMVRNSSTLLFSALMTRTFGVQRSRDPDDLCIRNRMTGRIFFLRYPKLYDYMLSKLSEVSATDSQLLRPALYPILLLLARLYPSSLEGTESNLKLAAFIPHIFSCAASCVLKTRQLAAKAIVPLVAPDQYIIYLKSMFRSISDKNMKKNHCHGILLQLSSLLKAVPDCTLLDEPAKSDFSKVFQENTMWIIESENLLTPCYLILDEYMKVINLILWKFPSTLSEQSLIDLEVFIKSLLFNANKSLINSGKDICLANGLYLSCIIMSQNNKLNDIKEFLYNCLKHESYEVNLAAMNYLLILHSSKEPGHCHFQKHLKTINNHNALKEFSSNDEYLVLLCNILKNNKYLECKRKSLNLLALQKNTQKYIVAVKSKVGNEITDEIITEVLFDCIENEHENLTHIYLQSLTDFVSEKWLESRLNDRLLLNIIRVIFACSSSENNYEVRSVVVGFMERNFLRLMDHKFTELNNVEKFELKATLLSTLVSTLEDDDISLRDRTSKIISKLMQKSDEVISSKSGEDLREYVTKMFEEDDCIAVMVILALLDFKSEVCLTDEINDECRVFDQSERYNIYLEETIWTNVCADIIIYLCKKSNTKTKDAVRKTTENNVYRQAIENLCGNNYILFEKLLGGINVAKNDAFNPKILVFVNKLSS